MFDIAMEILGCVCGLAGISMILFNFFKITTVAQKFFEFMRRHRVIAIVYVVLGVIGIFRALLFR